jgi:hypothetical protein
MRRRSFLQTVLVLPTLGLGGWASHSTPKQLEPIAKQIGCFYRVTAVHEELIRGKTSFRVQMVATSGSNFIELILPHPVNPGDVINVCSNEPAKVN